MHIIKALFSGLNIGLSHLCRGVHDGVVEAGHCAITLCLLEVAWAGCVIPPVQSLSLSLSSSTLSSHLHLYRLLAESTPLSLKCREKIRLFTNLFKVSNLLSKKCNWGIKYCWSVWGEEDFIRVIKTRGKGQGHGCHHQEARPGLRRHLGGEVRE